MKLACPRKRRPREGSANDPGGGAVGHGPGALECVGRFVMPLGGQISVRVGTDHFATGAGGELLINTKLRGDVVQAVQQVASRLDGGSRCGNGHEGCVVGHA